MSSKVSNPDPSDNGEASDFESLLISHQRRVYFFIRSMIFDPEDARDVLQDVNAIIIRKRDQFVVGTDFKSWSFAIARFECLAYLRRLKTKPVAPSEAFLHYLAQGAGEKADSIDSWIEALGDCRELLAKESGVLLDLRYRLRVPLEEIAHLWKTTEGALKQKLFRIRSQLKACILKRLAGNGIEENDRS